MEIALIYLIVIAVITAVYAFFKHKFSYWKVRNIPFLEPKFPKGNLQDVGTKKHLVEILDEVYFKLKGETPFVGAYFASSPVAVITDLDLVKNILIKDFGNFHDRGMYYNEKDDPISAHIVAIEGEKWKRLRTMLSPTFTSGKMKMVFPIIENISDKLVTAVNKEISNGEPLEVKELLARYTTDVIGNCAFGLECNSLADPEAEFRAIGRKVFTDLRYNSVVRTLLTQFPNLGRMLGLKVFSDEVGEFFNRVVKETVDYREKNNIKRNDLLDTLIRIKNGEPIEGKTYDKMTMQELITEAFLFFVGGFETSATTMSWTMYNLSLNPDIQQKAREHISEILDKHNGELTYESLTEMTYIDQIVNETLRLYPPFFTLFRKTIHDYQVPNSKYMLEKGTLAIIPSYSIQRDPNIFPDPEKFDPSRFSPEEIKKRHSSTFLSFGDGPRNCLGARFAKLQVRLGIVKLLQNFRFNKCSETMIPVKFDKSNVVFTADGGLKVQCEYLK